MNKKVQSIRFEIDEMDAISFCKALGKHGLKFEIGDLCNVIRPNDANKKRFFRVFTVHAPKKQMSELLKELGVE